MTMLQPSQLMMFEDQSHSYQVASPARTLALPVSRQDLTEKGQRYGLSLPGSFAKLNRNGCWLKMYSDFFQVTMDNSLETFSGTWPHWGTMLNGTCYRLLPLARPIKESEYSLLPTPQASEGLASTMGWARNGNKNAVLKRLRKGGQMHLLYIYLLLDLPMFSWAINHEWVMGFPIGWTDLEH